MMSISSMNSKTSKLALSLIFVATLAACGGSDDYVAPVVALDKPAVTVGTSTTAVAAAKADFGFVKGSTVTLPALTPKSGPAVAKDTKLTFTAIPAGAVANAVSGFKLESTGKVEEGTLIAGSCVFRVFSVNSVPVPFPYEMIFEPCAIDVQSGGLVVSGTTQNISVSIILNGVTTSMIVPVTVTLVNGQAVLTGPSGASLTVGLVTGA